VDASYETLDLLFSAVDERARLRAVGDEDGARAQESLVDKHVHALGAACAAQPARRDAVPPRAVQVAMATALFAAPHLGRTLTWAAAPGKMPGFQPCPPLADALGLSIKELDELRDAVDLRVSDVLRQGRALTWLWSRAGDPRAQPRTLFEQLFPADGTEIPERFVRRGTRLYAVVRDPKPLPPESLYLRWLPVRGTSGMWPDDTFQARYVDDLQVRALIRAVGVHADRARELLDNLVCVVPATDEARFLRRDRWRSEGWADLSGLGRASQAPGWLQLQMTPDALDDEALLERTDTGIQCRNARKVFDRQATTRILAAVNGLYTELCARLLTGEPFDPASLSRVFDLGTCIQRALEPLLAWPTQKTVIAHYAGRLGVPEPSVATALGQVRDIWVRAAQSSWGGNPTPDRPVTVQTVLAAHLAATWHGLGRAWAEPGDPRVPHQPLVLLFFAAYAQQVPLGRLWRANDGSLPAPEDIVGQWFGVLWRRVLDAIGLDDGEGWT